MGFNRWPESRSNPLVEPRWWLISPYLVQTRSTWSRTVAAHAIFYRRCPRCSVTFHETTLSRTLRLSSYASLPSALLLLLISIDRWARCFCTQVTGSRYRCNFGEGNFLRYAWKKGTGMSLISAVILLPSDLSRYYNPRAYRLSRLSPKRWSYGADASLFLLRNDVIGRIAETQVSLFRQENSCRLQCFRYGLLLPLQLRLQIK